MSWTMSLRPGSRIRAPGFRRDRSILADGSAMELRLSWSRGQRTSGRLLEPHPANVSRPDVPTCRRGVLGAFDVMPIAPLVDRNVDGEVGRLIRANGKGADFQSLPESR